MESDPRWEEDGHTHEEFVIEPDEMQDHVFGGFDFGNADLARVLSPPDLAGVWKSEHELEIEGRILAFSPEPPGWQVIFLDPPSREWARKVCERILESMTEHSGQTGQVL